MNKELTTIYNALDNIETKILEVRDEIEMNDDPSETKNAIGEELEEALEKVQAAMELADPKRFAQR